MELANTKPVGVWEGGFDIRLGDRWRAWELLVWVAHSKVLPWGECLSLRMSDETNA